MRSRFRTAPDAGRPVGERSAARATLGPQARRTTAGSRMPRRGARLVLLSATAVVPLALLAGCSSSAGSSGAASGTGTPSPSASVRYATLPSPCGALSAATVKSLVPGTAKPKGSEADSGQPSQRGGCSWNGLHGYQYRYLDTAFQRFDNLAGAAPADSQASAAFTSAVRAADTEASAVHAKPSTSTPHGIGDQATLIAWDAKKKHTLYRNITVVARSANAVVTVDYTGAGLQGDHKPTESGLRSGAERAVKQALAALG